MTPALLLLLVSSARSDPLTAPQDKIPSESQGSTIELELLTGSHRVEDQGIHDPLIQPSGRPPTLGRGTGATADGSTEGRPVSTGGNNVDIWSVDDNRREDVCWMAAMSH